MCSFEEVSEHRVGAYRKRPSEHFPYANVALIAKIPLHS